jgi:hypothetical protein
MSFAPKSDFLKPLIAISKGKIQYSIWAISAFVLGLSGFWLPILISSISNIQSLRLANRLLNAGILASFCVVIIADGVAGLFTYVTSKPRVLGLKGLVGMMALVIVIIQIPIFAIERDFNEVNPAFIFFQIIIALFSIAIATYLYCFRYPELWEGDVSEIPEKEIKDIDQLSTTAEKTDTDGTGVKL